MKIALIAPQARQHPSPASSAHGQRLASLAEALGQLGNAVTIDTGADARSQAARPEDALRARLERVPAAADGRDDDLGARIRALSERLSERWRSDPPDVVHAHSWVGGLAALAGARGLGVPVVQTVHTLNGQAHHGGGAPRGSAVGKQSRPEARLRLEVSLARNVNGVLATSSQTMRELTGFGVPRNAIRVVPSGVDTSRFAPEGPVARRTRQPRLLTVASPIPDQGGDTVVRALAEVPEAELVVLGSSGPEDAEDSGGRHALTRLGDELGVAERIRFAGQVAGRDLPALLRSADLFVSAAWDEPFGTVALQAMACGTPVVVSAVGCHQDAVIDGTTGMLVPPGQPSMLARRIRALLASPLRLEAFGIAASDRARARYSWDRIGRETLRAYRNCLHIEETDLDEVA